MNKTVYICMVLVSVGIVLPVSAQRERVGMSDDLNFIIVGVDGYYSDGIEQYFRIGDRPTVRGSVSGSIGEVSIRVIAPDGSTWYSTSVSLGPVKGYSYYITDDGIMSREWSSDNGFITAIKEFTRDDLEGEYRLIVGSGSSSVERMLVFKMVEGSDWMRLVEEQQRTASTSTASVVLVAISVIVAIAIASILLRKRSRSEVKSV